MIHLLFYVEWNNDDRARAFVKKNVYTSNIQYFIFNASWPDKYFFAHEDF